MAEKPTPGPFVRHGVMVRGTTETVGGMFCIRPAHETKSVTGHRLTAYGDVIGYAYSRADADLFAAAPALLSALKRARDFIESDLAWEGSNASDDLRAAYEAAEKAIRSAEGAHG